MFTLVLGGASCGKSRLAEELVLQSGVQPRVYIATMLPYGEESKARILRHQSMRAQKGFSTLECYTHLGANWACQKAVRHCWSAWQSCGKRIVFACWRQRNGV